MAPDLNALAVFALVAEERNFRAAADRLGVTRSAVSQSLRRLEEDLGIALVRRTTRSVSLTEAGERLYAQVAPAIAEMRTAVEITGSLRERPRGQLRLAVSSIAERFLSGAFLASFSEANPEIQLDINVTDEEFDIVAEGYDAGVRLGEVIAQDMIAVPVAGDERQLAVCSPAYRDRFGVPSHPRDLAAHRCIGWRRRPGLRPIAGNSQIRAKRSASTWRRRSPPTTWR
jgi:DNA-binding transcriptional LysR family regulator